MYTLMTAVDSSIQSVQPSSPVNSMESLSDNKTAPTNDLKKQSCTSVAAKLGTAAMLWHPRASVRPCVSCPTGGGAG